MRCNGIPFKPPFNPPQDERNKSWHDLNVVPRMIWGAKLPKWRWPIHDQIKYILCTYTEQTPCQDQYSCSNELRYLQQQAMSYEDNPDIRFNFLIGGDANIYEGRGWYTQAKVPMRFGKIGSVSLYIAFVGKFTHKPPSPKMFVARENLLKFGVLKGFIKPKFLLFTL